MNAQQKIDAFFAAFHIDDGRHSGQNFFKTENVFFKFEFAGFDLGKVQDIVYQAQERVGRCVDLFLVVKLLRGQFGFHGQMA